MRAFETDSLLFSVSYAAPAVVLGGDGSLFFLVLVTARQIYNLKRLNCVMDHNLHSDFV